MKLSKKLIASLPALIGISALTEAAPMLPGDNADFTQASESAVNGVVSIKSYATPRQQRMMGNQGFFNDPFFEYFFGSPTPQQPQQQPKKNDESSQVQTGLGSGVIISQDGYIVTNNHVVDGAERLEVATNDNRTFNATVIGTDPSTDIALIKIDEEKLPVIPMGDSDKLKVGEWVLAVGNPFGFTSTVTSGIVSAKARSIASATHSGRNIGIESYIQTDAAVNPGNSGGALVNLKGELVGINTAIYSQTGNFAGYSFAIPTSIVKKVTADLKQYGAVQRAVLGVSIQELNDKLAKENDITLVTQGVLVQEVNDQSSALQAGIKKGDVIVAVGGVETPSVATLQEQVAKYRPGDTVEITYVRDNKRHKVPVKLLNPQGTTKTVKAGSMESLGCAFKKASAETLKQLNLTSGVEVVDLKNGSFKDAGVKQGFIIYSVNDTRVSSPDDIEKIYRAVMKSDSQDKVLFIRGIYPTGTRNYYAVDISE